MTMGGPDLTRGYLVQLRKLPFEYLPDWAWMKAGGYTSIPDVGLYEHRASREDVYTINVLSLSGLFVLCHNDRFVKAEAITTDEELLRFLSSAKFPLPA
jgi:hypothetical protein